MWIAFAFVCGLALGAGTMFWLVNRSLARPREELGGLRHELLKDARKRGFRV